MSTSSRGSDSAAQEKSDANKCIAVGVGIGGLGSVAAVTLGATCPVCFIAAPALIGIGLYKRFSGRKEASEETDTVEKPPHASCSNSENT